LALRPAPIDPISANNARYHPTKNQINYYASKLAHARGHGGNDRLSSYKRLEALKAAGDCLDWQELKGTDAHLSMRISDAAF
jgi:hypothetical protein